MKKLLIAFSMVGAGALIACADTGAQSNSVTTNYAHQTWFGAKVTNGEIDSNGGSFSRKAGSESTVKAKESKIEFDSEIDDPVTFDVSNVLTTKLAKVTLELEAPVVPELALPTAEELTGAKTAFALVENQGKTVTNFQAWANGAWQSLAGLTSIPAAGDDYTLVMQFDDSAATKKVQFTVTNGTDGATSDWLTYAGLSTEAATKIDFVGCGKLNSMNADQVAIVSSEIIFEGGSVTIAEKDAAAMGSLVQPDETIEDVLKAEVASRFSDDISENCKLSVAEAYAIGLIAKKSGSDEMEAKDDGNFKVETVATAKVAENKIAVKFVNELTPVDPNVTITYSLLGQKTAGDKWTAIPEVQDKETVSDVAIPTSAVTEGYRYFKVVTKVQLKDAN